MTRFFFAADFVSERTRTWDALEELLRPGKLEKLPAADISRLAGLYREVCTDLSRAHTLGCDPHTLAYLDGLVSRAHSQIYSHGATPFLRFTRLLYSAFPRALRQNGWLFLFANVLFWVPFLITLIRSIESQDFSSKILPLSMLQQMAEAYQGDLSQGRNTGANAAMAGFYVYNNVGIAFRCFATGILFGLGSVFFLVYNGAVTGAVMGHVIRTGGGPNILTFICGHAPLELTAIVVSGAAGLQMGHALVATGQKTRLQSLWDQREPILYQVFGAASMLFLAALVEGFWSPSTALPQIKWAVSAILTLLVVLYLALAGRRTKRGAP